MLGIVTLNDEYVPLEAPHILSLRCADSVIPCRAEDGRLVVCGDHLYFVYSDCEDIRVTKGGFRVYVAELTWVDEQWQVVRCRIVAFPGNDTQRREKNWVPFVHEDTLLLAYSINPHVILQPNFEAADLVAYSKHEAVWNLGELRGGTPAVRDGDIYLAFFHSSQRIATLHSHGEQRMHYFMGAYTFRVHCRLN